MNTIAKATLMGKATAKQKKSHRAPAPAESVMLPFRVWRRNLEVAKALASHPMCLYDASLNREVVFEDGVNDSLNRLMWLGALRVRDLLKFNESDDGTLESIKDVARFLINNPESEECAGYSRPEIFWLLANFEEGAAAGRRVSLAVTQNDKHDDRDSYHPSKFSAAPRLPADSPALVDENGS